METVQLTAETEVRIRFSEVDSLKMVWHGHYLQYFESGREAFGAKYHLDYLSFYSKGYVIPLVKTLVEHKSPLLYGDAALIHTDFIDSPAAKIHMKYRVYSKNTGKLAATGETVQVFLDEANELCLTMPNFFTEWKKQWKLL